MKVFKITHANKIEDFIAAARPLQASSILCQTKHYTLEELEESEISEIQTKYWDNYYLSEEENSRYPLINTLDGITIGDWVKENRNESGFIASTEISN